MAITRQQKTETINKLSKIVKDSESMTFVNFHGLNVTDTTNLRKGLTAEKIGYLVAKKTLIRKVLGESKIEGEVPSLGGELAIAYGEDLIAPAREVFNFQKEHQDNLEILGGVFEGRFMDKEEMMGIATIPPVQVLYGQFVNIINSPIQGLAMVLDQIAQKKEE